MRVARLMLATILIATQSSCALLAAANTNHNSGGRACVDTPAYAIVDLGLGAASVGVLAGTGRLDESMAWMILPAVFFTTGVVGAIFVHRCTRPKQPEPAPAPTSGWYDDTYPVTPANEPKREPAPEEPPLEDAYAPPASTTPAAKLRLHDDYPIGAGSPPSDGGVDAPP
jgi:hypothetical protein